MSEVLQKNYSVELPKSIQKEIENVAKEMKLRKDQIKILEDEVKKRYLSYKAEPGEAIGIVAAQSISEPATQMTMRTYHFAGAAGIKVTYGLPRLIELFDAKRVPETPMMTIFLKKEFNNENDAKKIAEEIVEKRIVDVMKRISINLSENSIELELADKKRIGTVIRVIKEKYKNIKVREKGDLIIFSFSEEVDIKELKKMKEKIVQTIIGGIEGISNAVVRKEGENWIINSIGTNLSKILLMKEVDSKKTYTNDIHEIARTLGIEAARNAIINEALKTMQEQGLDVDIRHVMLVADMMTFTGEVSPIGRYGVAGAKTSIFARAAFEETIKHLVRASIKKESDNFQGIFENVMIGQVIPSGTGMFELVAKLEEE
ncbi:MAG: DNA-directed RNA polymerase subunit A'' [Candidatus Aenigmatarchaeota archaeon]